MITGPLFRCVALCIDSGSSNNKTSTGFYHYSWKLSKLTCWLSVHSSLIVTSMLSIQSNVMSKNDSRTDK